MNENKLGGEMYLITDAESIKKAARRDGYALLNLADLRVIEIDIDDLSDEMKKEGYVREGDTRHEVIYDPNRFEVQTVNVRGDLNKPFSEKEYSDEGWKEVSRTGDTALMIKEKNK